MDRDAVVGIFDALIARFDGVERKGKTMPYSAVNGNMFVFVSPEGELCMRLSKEDKADYEAQHGAGDVIQYNSVMRGYVPVVEAIIGDENRPDTLFAKSLEFARGLKPKPTKKG